jgi:hypothetical protein
VPDPDELYTAFATGLRAAYGRLPVAGIPRIVRPRTRWGTVYGFSVVDVGGNWLRISKTGAREAPPDATEPGLTRSIEVAARLADAQGDDEQALKAIAGGLERNSDALAPERARALLYRAELEIRLGRTADARTSLAAVAALDLVPQERSALAEDLAHVTDLLAAT